MENIPQSNSSKKPKSLQNFAPLRAFRLRIASARQEHLIFVSLLHPVIVFHCVLIDGG